MQDLRITLVQADQTWEDKSANFDNYSRLLEGVQTDLILLPELFHTGFSMNVAVLAEDFNDSTGIKWLKTQARKHNAAIYTSLIIREADQYMNRGIFVFPDEGLVSYDKRKSFSLAGEDKLFTAGTTTSIVEYKGWKINLQICYDLRFPEVSRNQLGTDASPIYDLLLYVANWPDRRISHWDALLPARAIENQCYVAAVNRVGTDANELTYNGFSMIVDPLGSKEISPQGTQCANTFVIKYNFLQEIRTKLPFLKDI